jgi:GR25 family glycosyltransferase involved in LPS biosynthesis
MKTIIDKIFICHHTPLVHRKQRIGDSLSSCSIPIEWVEGYLPEQISQDYGELIGTNFLDTSGTPEQNQHPWENEKVGKRISMSELSLYLKHQYCFSEQVSKEYSNVLIFEDDAVIPENFEEYLQKCIDEFINFETKLDCLMIGTCCGFKCNNVVDGKLVYYDPSYVTRCTHAMMFPLKTSKKIVDNLWPVNWPIDYKLNQIMYQQNFKVGHVEPPIYQGTDLGIDISYIHH